MTRLLECIEDWTERVERNEALNIFCTDFPQAFNSMKGYFENSIHWYRRSFFLFGLDRF